MTQQKIIFKGEKEDRFLSDVRKQVEEYFRANNLKKQANYLLHLKGAAIALSCAFIYCTLLFGWFPVIPRAFFWLLFGVHQALISVNIAHDAIHGSYTSSPRLNALLGYLAYDCIGLSSYIWSQTHNKEHHTFTNIAGADPDIHKPGLLRLSPHDPYYPVHRWQHWYIWFLYSLVGLNWVLYADYHHMWEERNKVSKKDLALFFLFKAINLTWVLVIPLLYFPMAWWEVLMGYILFQIAGGVTVSVIFQLAHVVEDVAFPLPDKEGVIPTTWGAHEMHTTSNFATHNPFVTHFVGGLNFQVEHHLFPKISHCHYPAISAIVKENAAKYGLPYYEQPSTFAAICSHARTLKKLGCFNLTEKSV